MQKDQNQQPEDNSRGVLAVQTAWLLLHEAALTYARHWRPLLFVSAVSLFGSWSFAIALRHMGVEFGNPRVVSAVIIVLVLLWTYVLLFQVLKPRPLGARSSLLIVCRDSVGRLIPVTAVAGCVFVASALPLAVPFIGLIPAIYIFARLQHAVENALVKNQGPLSALRSAWELSKHRNGLVFGTLAIQLAAIVLLGIFFAITPRLQYGPMIAAVSLPALASFRSIAYFRLTESA